MIINDTNIDVCESETLKKELSWSVYIFRILLQVFRFEIVGHCKISRFVTEMKSTIVQSLLQ